MPQLAEQMGRERTSRLPAWDRGLIAKRATGCAHPQEAPRCPFSPLSPSEFLPGLTAIFCQRLWIGRQEKTRLGTTEPQLRKELDSKLYPRSILPRYSSSSSTHWSFRTLRAYSFDNMPCWRIQPRGKSTSAGPHRLPLKHTVQDGSQSTNRTLQPQFPS